MKVTSASFTVQDKAGQEYSVEFRPDDIHVYDDDYDLLRSFTRDGRYKPCATHAVELVRLAMGIKPKHRTGQRRAEALRPALKVFPG